MIDGRQSRQQAFRRQLIDREQLLGLLHFAAAPRMLEVTAFAGFDFVVIDTEHTPLDRGEVERLLTTADAAGLPALVRVPEAVDTYVLSALDSGAQGIVVPHVRDTDEARAAVRLTKYAPLGERGMCPAIRSASYGRVPWSEYSEDANDATVVVCLIEDVAGIERSDEIASVSGVDVLWCGTGDLSQSLGIGHAGLEHPAIREAMTTLRDACHKHGKAFMATAGSSPNPAYVHELREFGATVVSLGPDLDVVRRALASIVNDCRTAAPAAAEHVIDGRTS